VNKITSVKQKIIIIGDNHARNSAAELQHNLGSTFTVSSFVKPGAGMGIILDAMKEDIKKLKSGDVVIVWGGSNDIGKNNSKEALKHFHSFIHLFHIPLILYRYGTSLTLTLSRIIKR
jgi:lysophospholipase L1-like esterase